MIFGISRQDMPWPCDLQTCELEKMSKESVAMLPKEYGGADQSDGASGLRGAAALSGARLRPGQPGLRRCGPARSPGAAEASQRTARRRLCDEPATVRRRHRQFADEAPTSPGCPGRRRSSPTAERGVESTPDARGGRREAAEPTPGRRRPRQSRPAKAVPGRLPRLLTPHRRSSSPPSLRPRPRDRLDAGRFPAAATRSSGRQRPTTSRRSPASVRSSKQVLNDLGVWTYAQIAAWSSEEIAWVDDYLSFSGRIGRDDWIEQAASAGCGFRANRPS